MVANVSQLRHGAVFTWPGTGNAPGGVPIGLDGIWLMLSLMPDDSPPIEKPPPKSGDPRSLIQTNEEQRHEAARKLAERHNAGLRASRDGTRAAERY